MSSGKGVMQDAKDEAQDAALSYPVAQSIRLGYAVRGIVYGLIGVLALLTVLRAGEGALDGSQGAIATIARAPLGEVLLLVVVVGLGAYALWGLLRAILDPLQKGSDAQGIAARAGYVVSAVTYGALTYYAMSLLLTARESEGGGGGMTDVTVSLLASNLGRWALGVAGVVWLVANAVLIYRAWRGDWRQDLRRFLEHEEELAVAINLGRVGETARRLVLSLVAWSLIGMAWFSTPTQSLGIDSGLATVANAPYGPWLLSSAALGFVAFGAWSLAAAWLFELRIR